MTLALAEAVRCATGRFSLLFVLMASVASGSCFRWPPAVCAVVSLGALACIAAFSLLAAPRTEEWWDPQHMQWWQSFVASDFLLGNVHRGGLVETWACVAMSIFFKVGDDMSVWAFMAFVFPCVCAWQRQRFAVFSKLALKDETVLYCIACVAALALCCAVYEPFTLLLLCVHFGLRWSGPLLVWLFPEKHCNI
jgi:hypothetical protein